MDMVWKEEKNSTLEKMLHLFLCCLVDGLILFLQALLVLVVLLVRMNELSWFVDVGCSFWLQLMSGLYRFGQLQREGLVCFCYLGEHR